MNYYCYKVTVSTDVREAVMAFFSQLPFDTFEETEAGFNAYLPANRSMADLDQQVKAWASQFDYTFDKGFIPAQNWNAVWESNFEPIIIDDFCAARAEFHPPQSGVQHEIVIRPKMAFGTGHHATTYMMMAAMEYLDFENAKVLDYGCGTGILAILAEMLGAKLVDAVDIEREAYENTLEHAALNQCQSIKPVHGTLEDISGSAYAVILANINRNVILDSLWPLHKKLNPNGHLLVSGILLKDRVLVVEKATQTGFTLVKSEQRGDWCCLDFTR